MLAAHRSPDRAARQLPFAGICSRPSRTPWCGSSGAQSLPSTWYTHVSAGQPGRRSQQRAPVFATAPCFVP